MARQICIITGTRAEYGLLYWLMKEIEGDQDLRLQLVVTGMHLSPEFGNTYKLIEQDGFQIDEKVEMVLSADTQTGIAKSVGLGVIGFTAAFDRLKPDIVVVLGDRYEILAGVQAAMMLNLPIAHLCGGEVTKGAIDDSIRHAITKMSHLHFVGTEAYRKRVIQLGESPGRVFNFGSVGLDNIRRLQLMTRDELNRFLPWKLEDPTFLITYHPVTLQPGEETNHMDHFLAALHAFPEAKFIFTMPNSDAGGRAIAERIENYAGAHPQRAVVYSSMGQVRYLSAMKETQVVIGNSSSGIIEAPYFRVPTVNIGLRQEGRLKASSIIDCKEDKDSIERSIRLALSAQFRSSIASMKLHYETGDASFLTKEQLKKVSLESITQKEFYDLA